MTLTGTPSTTIFEWTAAEHLAAAEGLDTLAEFAQRLRDGQGCEDGGCANVATWVGVAAGITHFGCDTHTLGLLDRFHIWYLHPLPMGER